MANTKHNYQGFGFCDNLRRHHFEVMVPKTDKGAGVTLIERREKQSGTMTGTTMAEVPLKLWKAVSARVAVQLNQRVKEEHQAPKGKFESGGVTKVEASLGKELAVLMWGLELIPDVSDHAVANRVFDNWCNMLPEERWWLYRMGYDDGTGKTWRYATHVALAEAAYKDGKTEYKAGALGKSKAAGARVAPAAVKTRRKWKSR